MYAYPYCPLRQAAHRVVDHSAPLRLLAALAWPAARRAESLELSETGIEAVTLTGRTRLAWSDVRAVRIRRALLGHRTLRIEAPSGRIAVAVALPGFDELERHVRETVATRQH